MSKVEVERKKRFSKSMLWDLQRGYFEEQGIFAWVNQVPYFVTSNSYVGETYANMVISFIRDWISNHPESKSHPFYIMELGTGSGQLSFYINKKLHELRKAFNLEEIKFCYVMTDFTSHNIQYWETHKAFKSFLEKGELDFAVYNMEEEKANIHLMHANKTLKTEDFKNPLIVFANYIFDTVSHDAFRIVDDQLQELRISLQTDPSNMKNGRPIAGDKVEIEYHSCQIPGAFYEDKEFEAILRDYPHHLKNTYLLMPIGALKTIRALHKLSGGKMLMISTDKGYSRLQDLNNLGKPHIAFHGSFSMMVNFHAIKTYVERLGGAVFDQSPRHGIKTIVCELGFSIKDLPHFKYAVEQYVDRFAAADYFSLHQHMTSVNPTALALDVIAAHLKLSSYDPYVLHKLVKRINENIAKADYVTQLAFKEIMPKIVENYYHMPKSHDTCFDVGLFFHTLKDYQTALKYYQQSEEYFGESYNICYNYGLCHYYAGDPVTAFKYFKRAAAIKPDSKEAQEWMVYIGEQEKS